MLPKPSALLLKNRVKLYNNIAKCGDCAGRLHAELQVYPSPRIAWEFESLGDMACDPTAAQSQLPYSFIGNWFTIDEAYVSQTSWGTTVGQSRVSIEGNAGRASYGDLDSGYHAFSFYLSNARFQERNLGGQGKLEKYIRAEVKQKNWDTNLGSEGRFVIASIDNTWNIHLETRQEALKWLEPKQNNVGTFITTAGRLYHPKNEEDESEAMIEAPTLTMDEVLDRLGILSMLLSFANGGYLGPLYVEAVHRNGDELEFSAVCLPHETTPLEQLGTSWLTNDSDLEMYIQRLPALERMLSTPWKEVLDLILIWYFQAIQPQNVQTRGRPWPIVANAVGAALEHLSVTILAKELKIKRIGNNPEKIRLLLEYIGITKARGFSDVDDVQTFVNIRNDATHPKSTTAIPRYERDRIINQSIQWIEEVLLWRLGYAGKYRDRSIKHYASIGPRYDLSKRDSSW